LELPKLRHLCSDCADRRDGGDALTWARAIERAGPIRGDLLSGRLGDAPAARRPLAQCNGLVLLAAAHDLDQRAARPASAEQTR
jgi:hypothetical protein